MKMVRKIPTMGGVTSVEQPEGEITLALNESGDNVADLTVDDGAGNTVTVHVNYAQMVRLALAAGVIADDIG